MLTWTTTILLIVHNAIRINLQINVVLLVGSRRTTLKTGKSRKYFSILGRNKNLLLPLSFFQAAKTGFGNHPTSNSVSTDCAPLKIKRQVHNENHSVQYTAEVKIGWSYIYAPTYARMEYKKKYIHLTSQTYWKWLLSNGFRLHRPTWSSSPFHSLSTIYHPVT
jgi:hypothetical protein